MYFSGELKHGCCADYEAALNDCIGKYSFSLIPVRLFIQSNSFST